MRSCAYVKSYTEALGHRTNGGYPRSVGHQQVARGVGRARQRSGLAQASHPLADGTPCTLAAPPRGSTS